MYVGEIFILSWIWMNEFEPLKVREGTKAQAVEQWASLFKLHSKVINTEQSFGGLCFDFVPVGKNKLLQKNDRFDDFL